MADAANGQVTSEVGAPAAAAAAATAEQKQDAASLKAQEEANDRADARIFDTKHVFFDPVTMEPDGWPKESAKHEATLTGFDKLSIPLIPDMMDRVAEDIDVDFLSASKALLTFPNKEAALAVHAKYDGYRFGKCHFKVELHLSKPYPKNRLGVGRYVKKVDKGSAGQQRIWIDVAFDSTATFRLKSWNSEGKCIAEETVAGTAHLVVDIESDSGKREGWDCPLCKWHNKWQATHCSLCSWEHAYRLDALPDKYTDAATLVITGKRFYWQQVVLHGRREWQRRTQAQATKSFKVAALRGNFVFAPGNHIGVHQYADMPGYMPRTGEAAMAAEVAREEKADAEWLHNEELLRKQKEEREVATNKAQPDVDLKADPAAASNEDSSAVESVPAVRTANDSASDQSPPVEAETKASENHDPNSKSSPGVDAVAEQES